MSKWPQCRTVLFPPPWHYSQICLTTNEGPKFDFLDGKPCPLLSCDGWNHRPLHPCTISKFRAFDSIILLSFWGYCPPRSKLWLAAVKMTSNISDKCSLHCYCKHHHNFSMLTCWLSSVVSQNIIPKLPRSLFNTITQSVISFMFVWMSSYF